VETVVVAAARSSSFALSGMQFIVSVVVVAVVAFGVVTGLKYFRNRTARGA
jgi:hypothetical protein